MEDIFLEKMKIKIYLIYLIINNIYDKSKYIK